MAGLGRVKTVGTDMRVLCAEGRRADGDSRLLNDTNDTARVAQVGRHWLSCEEDVAGGGLKELKAGDLTASMDERAWRNDSTVTFFWSVAMVRRT